jgi:hypothetical protein
MDEKTMEQQMRANREGAKVIHQQEVDEGLWGEPNPSPLVVMTQPTRAERRREKFKPQRDEATEEEYKKLQEKLDAARGEFRLPDWFFDKTGIIGELTKKIAPSSESDPVAIFMCLLAFSSTYIGRNPYFNMGAKHYPLFYITLVGKSASARKTNSFQHPRNIFLTMDEIFSTTFMKNNLASGLSSGQGLVARVKDDKIVTDKDGNEEVIKGVEEKNVLFFQPDISEQLVLTQTQGNTLPETMMDLYDHGSHGSTVKGDPQQTTDAHVGILANSTIHILQDLLNKKLKLNGFANRYLWLKIFRVRYLPEGGEALDYDSMARELKPILDRAKRIEEVIRDQAATNYWDKIYADLSKEKAGLSGVLLNRAEAICTRLQVMFCAINGRTEITVDDIDCSLEIWRLATASVYDIFGGTSKDTDNPVANKIRNVLIANLSEEPPITSLSRDEIFREVFHKNTFKKEIEAALQLLEEMEIIETYKDEHSSGRPTERIRLLDLTSYTS